MLSFFLSLLYVSSKMIMTSYTEIDECEIKHNNLENNVEIISL